MTRKTKLKLNETAKVQAVLEARTFDATTWVRRTRSIPTPR